MEADGRDSDDGAHPLLALTASLSFVDFTDAPEVVAGIADVDADTAGDVTVLSRLKTLLPSCQSLLSALLVPWLALL